MSTDRDSEKQVDGDVKLVTTAAAADDEAELARMGYKQELKRDLGLLQNFGVSFSIISVMTGIPTLFLFGLNTGGPAVMTLAWLVVSFFTMMVGLAMAEVCSSTPTSGGPYFWSAKLAPAGHAAFASWITGWFNLLGQVAVTTGISYGCANFLATAATIGTDFAPNAKNILGIYAAVLVAQGVHLLRHINNVSIVWHAVGTIAVIIAVLAAAPKHQSAKWVFTQFIDGTGGWGDRASHAYVMFIGILMAQYTLTGFDASAHMTEETHNAAVSGSWGIVMSIGDFDTTVASESGQPVLQIFLDTMGRDGAIVCMVIVIGCMFWCGTFSITSNSRMMYAFSRDGALPGSKFFHRVDEKRKSPIRTVWLACTLSFILALPSLGNSVAFAAATSIATIGLYVSYGIPILLRVIYSKKFEKGPWHLGAFSIPISIIAVVWICFIAILFMLPQVNPVTSETLNYAPVAVGIVMVYSLGLWLISGRKWFKGPIQQIAAEERGIDVMEPGALERAEREGKLQ
ncbi:APC amino acid permease [Auriculariales sp. MPI-PUGE-AT-0066]|nr:APC amino acid permease [Auriculariales sp. MPI-PUGE-AT-0066]